MRAVLDTNVLVSGLLNPAGPCGRLIDLFNESFFQPVYNAGIMAEYESVLLRPEFGFDPEAVDWLLSRVKARGFASNKPFPPAGIPDPGDEAFLEAARGADSAFIVTGNLRHFPAAKCHGVQVLGPRQFLARLADAFY